jgi:tripartite-type tricarboxylate transporter receptor subunit TctC
MIDRVWADPYPARPIKIISPFSAGSPPDTLMRVVAQRLAERLGQGVAVENRPGGGTTIATKAAAAAEADGYTLLQANSALAYATTLHPNSGYDPLTSFSAVAPLASWSHLLVVPADVPAATAQELIAYARANPAQFNIGFPLGSPPQVLAELFKTASGAPLNAIPYRQISQLIADLLAGRLQAFFGAGANLVALVQKGKLKALAYTGTARYTALPDVPTVTESGLPQLALNPSDWTGILAPAGTPSNILGKLNAEISQILQSPEVQTNIRQQGGEPMITSSQDFAAFIAAEAKKWPALVAGAGMAAE